MKKIIKKMKIISHNNRWGIFTQVVNITNDGCGTATVDVYDEEPNIAHIHSISVVKNKRQQGYGNKLLEACEKYAKKRKQVKIIDLWADTDTFAFEWYKRHGYQPTNEWQVLTPKVCLMRLEKVIK